MGMQSQACAVDESATREFFVELTCRNVVSLMIPLTRHAAGCDPRDAKHFQNTARLFLGVIFRARYAHPKMAKEMILNHHCF
jgi:hypothetical protein